MEQQETNRRCFGEGSSKEGQSSYAKLKVKMKSNHVELEHVQGVLQETHRIKIVLEGDLVKVRMELQGAQMELHSLCTELEEVKRINKELLKVTTDENTQLKRKLGLRWLHMKKLNVTITADEIRQDAMVAEVELLERTMAQQKAAKYKDTKRKVCRAFGWSIQKADPVLLRAACGFWESCTLDAKETHDRNSGRTRQQIWYELTCRGFQGKILEIMEKGLKMQNKFDVVELARKSDVDSRFNASSLGAVAHCETGRKKYERGLLCSDATLRRTQKQVCDLTKSVGAIFIFPDER